MLYSYVFQFQYLGLLYMSTCVARWDKALGCRPGGHAFKSCHRHIRCALLAN